MLTLFHAPMSRSTRIVSLIDELGATDQVDIRQVGVRRMDGGGASDPANPHPEGKVPLLVHDGAEIRESTAIAQYLCELFPEAGMAPMHGDPLRGPFLSWMAWYGGVLEPVFVMQAAKIDHPLMHEVFRGMPELTARLEAALVGPYLLGENYSAADLIVASAFAWAPQAIPETGEIGDWVARCNARPSVTKAFGGDAAALEAQKAG